MIRHSVYASSAGLALFILVQTAGIGAALAPAGSTVAAGATAVDFSVTLRGLSSTWEVTPLMVMPGERVSLEALAGYAREPLRLSASTGRVRQLGSGRWEWEAPVSPGVYDLRIDDRSTGGRRLVTAFVLHPYRGEPTLNGYRIGRYQDEPLNGDPAYARPTGFIEVTPENEDTRVSPHFVLRQFLSKQESGYPKYVLVQPRLLMKLERLVTRLQRRGIDAASLHVMSAYRTPAYNAAIGNATTYSRHAYGDAADVFIDRNRDGWMDDLDGDGRATFTDAQLIYDEIDRLAQDVPMLPLAGGLGLYPPNPQRGPFVHMDTRGHRARW